MSAPDFPSSTSSKPPLSCLPELLAPAGDWDCVRAAVENGADAVYFGLDRFNARMRAKNFTEADLPALMEFLHRRGVRGYVTFNTLVFTDELPAAVDYLRSIISAGVDAAIVQDIGICKIIRQLSSDFPIHGSTQMTITNAAGVEFARDLGCNLVVLARENSIKEIEAIQESFQGPDSSSPGLPLEVFVHGALCVAYSGQCLTSESLGGRSANRGECAQACRMPYELVSDGKTVELGDRRYLLSPQDLSGLEVLPELVRAGVSSLKIEGRLKSPHYVASITRVYREALDALGGGTTGKVSRTREARYELEMAFSRGLYTGWFRGIQNQELAHARFGKKRGVFVGEVVDVGREVVRLRPGGPIKPGDGVGFDAGRPDLPEEGGRVYTVRPLRDGLIEIDFGHGTVDFSRIQPGNRIWKTDDPELSRELAKTYDGDAVRYRQSITVEVHGHAGVPLTLILRDRQGHVVQADSVPTLVVAEKRPLTTETLSEQLGRFGGTPFCLGNLVNKLEGQLMLPVSELNRLRRDGVTKLEALRAYPQRWALGLGPPDSFSRVTQTEGLSEAVVGVPELIILVRTLGQLEAALSCGATSVYCDFEDAKKYREAVTTFHTAHGCQTGVDGRRPEIFVAPPRISKPGEEWILKQVLSSNADGYLVRNVQHIRYFAGHRQRGDFSLNVANPVAAEHFIRNQGLERVTISYDLNVEQVCDLLIAAPPSWFELTLHQHMPMFHMEHCVFCAFLSKGKDFTDCGRPCDSHDLRLRDRVGIEHPIKADSGCRNTVFNARAQTGAEFAGRFLALGARAFRVEFLNETPNEVVAVMARYRALLRGEISGEQLWREFKLQNQLGVTRGQMETVEFRKVFPETSKKKESV
ncbi:MAG: U32 family peptidase [Pedosphaera sp.]|nr:U32 family peptidase [Pedosphaera sp.]